MQLKLAERSHYHGMANFSEDEEYYWIAFLVLIAVKGLIFQR